MRRTLTLLPEVEFDISEAYWWYEEKGIGLGDEFLRCLEEAFSRITHNPGQFAVRFDDVKRILVRRFPYAVYFYHDDFCVFVTHVFHTARNPDNLMVRLRNPNKAIE
jgi:plasmid stabilization system protein ParE